MAPLTTVEKNREILSLALEDRSSGYEDLVSNSNPLLALLRLRGNYKEYSGPIIRERLLYNKSGSAVWYRGFEFLNPVPAELFNDAEFTPKMCAVAITLANEDILNNEGSNQLLDILETHIEAGENELVDEVGMSVHGNGTRFGGRELTGLQQAIPTVNDAGMYGGIDRGQHDLWRTGMYDIQNSLPASFGTQVTKDNVRAVLNYIMTKRSRGKRGAGLLCMSAEHYAAYDAATVAIQRITDQTTLGKMGFTSLQYIGAGRRAEIAQDGGIGSSMPANTTYGIDLDSMRLRYHPERNFSKINDKPLTPVNQDAVVQYIGFMGELTMANSLFNWKLIDSNPAQ